MYNITYATSAVPGNELGIFEDLGDYYAQEDLNLFFATLQQRIPQGTGPILKGIDGAQAPASVANAGPESDLDFQISYPIIYPQKSVLFQTDDPVYEANYTYEGFLNNFLDAIDGSYCSYSAYGETGNSPLDPSYPNPAAGGYKGNLQCGVYKPTNVISISYGGQEADLPASYQQRQCNEYMKLGLQGISILVASGDSGVAGPAGDGSANGCLNGGTVFSPDFPASCPYITTVGATLLTGNVKTDSETAVTRFPSGGGFSNIYPIPSYQANAVASYFKNSPPPYKSYSGSTYGDGICMYLPFLYLLSTQDHVLTDDNRQPHRPRLPRRLRRRRQHHHLQQRRSHPHRRHLCFLPRLRRHPHPHQRRASQSRQVDGRIRQPDTVQESTGAARYYRG
jgi:tripeptidyl-peptidase-1